MLRAAVNGYLKRSAVEIESAFEIDNFAMAISLVTSMRGVALLPSSVRSFLPWSVTSRRLTGEQPTVDLMIGYHKTNKSPILKKFLSRIDELTNRIYGTAGRKIELEFGPSAMMIDAVLPTSSARGRKSLDVVAMPPATDAPTIPLFRTGALGQEAESVIRPQLLAQSSRWVKAAG